MTVHRVIGSVRNGRKQPVAAGQLTAIFKHCPSAHASSRSSSCSCSEAKRNRAGIRTLCPPASTVNRSVHCRGASARVTASPADIAAGRCSYETLPQVSIHLCRSASLDRSFRYTTCHSIGLCRRTARIGCWYEPRAARGRTVPPDRGDVQPRPRWRLLRLAERCIRELHQPALDLFSPASFIVEVLGDLEQCALVDRVEQRRCRIARSCCQAIVVGARTKLLDFRHIALTEKRPEGRLK